MSNTDPSSFPPAWLLVQDPHHGDAQGLTLLKVPVTVLIRSSRYFQGVYERATLLNQPCSQSKPFNVSNIELYHFQLYWRWLIHKPLETYLLNPHHSESSAAVYFEILIELYFHGSKLLDLTFQNFIMSTIRKRLDDTKTIRVFISILNAPTVHKIYAAFQEGSPLPCLISDTMAQWLSADIQCNRDYPKAFNECVVIAQHELARRKISNEYTGILVDANEANSRYYYDKNADSKEGFNEDDEVEV